MTPEQWTLARALFDAAVERPIDERFAFLEEAAALDPRIDRIVRDEARAMLAADDDWPADATRLSDAAPDLIADLHVEVTADERRALIGQRVGPWMLVRELGRGGMGAVYLGERAEGDFRQQAAVKLVHTGWEAGELQRRFRSERRILASLDHPHIARLIDGGETADGKPYLAMEFVDGQPLCAHCDQRRLPIAERLRLFVAVCAAVSHAHRSLIVHRDLKPSNVLVGADGEVKLLDFGIARLLEPGFDGAASAIRLFTPDYAAPEQIRGDPLTTRVDVYSLGLILFELLTGQRPYACATSSQAALEQAILTTEPNRPSVQVQTGDVPSRSCADARGVEPYQLALHLRGDLDAIVLKALRKEPGQRYESVEALSADVQRHLAHEPVSARRGNWRYRSGRLVQRHRLAAAFATLALGAIVSGLGLALWQAQKARQQEVLARNEADKARAVSDFLTGIFKSAEPGSNDGSNPRASELLERAVAGIDAQTDLEPTTRAGMLMAMANAYLAMEENARGLALMREARQSALRADDPRLRVETQLELARALDSNGQSSLALLELEQTERFVADDPRSDRVLRLRLEYILAIVLNNLDRPVDALPHVERAYREATAKQGIGSVDAGKLVALYSTLLVSLRRVDDAIALTRANYEASRTRSDMPLLLRTNFASAYGYALLHSKRPADAEQPYREALASDEKLYGVENIATAIAMNNVAAALRHAGKYGESASMGERVLALRRAHMAPDSAGVARSLGMLGSTHLSAGDLDQAVRYLREAVAIFDRRGEDDRSSAITVRINLVRALEATGEYAQALDVLAGVLPQTQRASSQYAGSGGAGILLTHARLLARVSPDGKDCDAIARVIEVAPAGTVEAVEAHVLAADCERRNGRADEVARHLRVVAGADSTVDALTDYARLRLDDLRSERR